ncbi:MAG: glycerophosphodiester phosphodiesterase family protein [Pseudomonadota bacterium]
MPPQTQPKKIIPPNTADPGRIIAHRGASHVAPENTLTAFREAARQGVRWIEFDVSLLGDSTAIVHHDPTVDRCSLSTGALSDLRIGDLPKLDMGSRKALRYAGETMPLLSEVLDLMEQLELFANLEIKLHHYAPEVAAAVVASHLDARPWSRDRIIVSSFRHEVLAELREIAPAQPIALLYRAPPPGWEGACRDLRAAAVHLEFRHLSEEVLRGAERAGLDVRVYTINRPDVVAPFREIGLTGVITDHPPLFLDEPDWRDWAGLPGAGCHTGTW